jgi:hypothetical protein
VPFARIDVQQERLRQRHDRRAEQSLEHAKQNHLFEAPGETAQHGRDGETDDGNQEEFAAADAVGQAIRSPAS